MKLQKVIVILGISVCLIATQMQATFGIGESEQEDDLELIEEEELEESNTVEIIQADKDVIESEPADPVEEETPKEENDFVTEIPEGEVENSEEEAPDSGGSSDEEEPMNDGDGSDEETPSEEETPDGEESPDKEETPDGEETPSEEETPDREETPGEEETPDGEESPDKEGSPDKEETPDGEEDSGEEGIPDNEEGSGEEDTSGDEGISGGEEAPGDEENSDDDEIIKEEHEKDNDIEDDLKDGTKKAKEAVRKDRTKTEDKVQKTKGAEAVGKTSKRGNIFSSFVPSSEFIDNREKVKYNVDVPVDGLPGFITQEMLVGALKCQDETGYPASVTIAQIIQESGFGKYGPDGDKRQGLSYLAYQYNNLFGIKGSGTAGSVAMNTGEQRLDGSRYSITAGFRVYNTYTECIEDRTSLLDRVYKDLTFGVKDANTFAMKIGRRWATSLSYGQNLIRQMNRYDLYRLDAMTLDEFSGMIGTFANPCPGARLTSSFGYREAPLAGASAYHKGVDLGTGAYNIPTYAAQAGTVIFAGASGAAGNLVVIDHGNGLVTKYMHHDKVYVKSGDKVEKGQQIGLSGTTGNSTGNHLHFQVEKDGTAINPLIYLDIQ